MKPLVLLSGGLDSLASLAIVLREKPERVGALTFDYQQTNSPELLVAERTALRWGVEFWKRDEVFLGGSDARREIPARNVIFLARALELALTQGYDTIVLGAEPDAVYLDSSVEFVERASAMCETFGVRVIAPVKRLRDKRDVVAVALDLGVPLHEAHSSLAERVDGRCVASARFLKAVGATFPGLDPAVLLSALALIHRSRDPGQDPRDLSFRVGGSFKTIAALFVLGSLPDDSPDRTFDVYTTGSWGEALESVNRLFFGAKFEFKINTTNDPALFRLNRLSTGSRAGQWGIRQSFSRLLRPHLMPRVAVPVVQGHLKFALEALGYEVNPGDGLPAVRLWTRAKRRRREEGE